MRLLPLVALLSLSTPALASSHSSYHGHSYGHAGYGTSHSHYTHSSTTSHGGHKRDPAQRRAFQRFHPCPSTGKTSGACPGYVVDHVTPLKRGGADAPSNMQWQTVAEGKAKDRVE